MQNTGQAYYLLLLARKGDGKVIVGNMATEGKKRATFCNALNLGHMLAAAVAVAWQHSFSFRTSLERFSVNSPVNIKDSIKSVALL